MEHKRTRAQSLVEFALLLPVLLLVMLTLIDAALVFQGYLTVSHASREAMRFAIVYQPNQGECLHRDISGLAIPEPYPDCPVDLAEYPAEPDAAYYARRSLLIKRAAIEATVGLRAEIVCSGADSAACVTENNDEPGMLGVRIWGFQAFDAAEEPDMPGLQGLPVRVQVIHNVPLVIYGALLPNAYIQVRSMASGINEGVQVGFGNLPPPTFAPVPPPVPPGTAIPTNTPAPTVTPGGPTPTPTPVPNYTISLNFETALNQLPDERSHNVIAHVQDEGGGNVGGARVTFRTDFGSFSPAGMGMPSIIVSTDGNGLARVTLYANRPGVSTVIAWLNYNEDGEIDPEEPVDTAIKTWEVVGPYLIVSNHNPIPNDWLAVSVMDHPPSGNPHSLWWCPSAVTSTQVTAQLAYPVNVDGITYDIEDVPVQVPLGVSGSYRIESHSGDGGANGCSQSGTLVAYSGDIEIAAAPPDLIVENVFVVDEAYIRVGEPVTLVITVSNQSPIAVNTGPFDVDVYIPQEDPPQVQQMSLIKQWAPNLPALDSYVLTATVTLYDNEEQQLWVQVDTTDYIEEGDVGGEDNNVFGPVILQAAECVPLRGRTDDFSSGWTGMTVPDGYYTAQGGNLSVYPVRGEYYNRDTADRRGGYSMVYQPAAVSGDFEITVRVDGVNTTYPYARAGLVVQAANDFNAVRFAVLKMSDSDTVGVETQYRTAYAGNISNSRAGNLYSPIYLRISRQGNNFRSYYSTDGANWTQQRSQNLTAMPADVIVGLVTSGLWFNGTGNGDITGPAIYDDFEMCTPPGASCVAIPGRSDTFDSGLGAQWTFENVALPPASSSAGGGSLTVTPGWGDIYNVSDGFYYFYQQPVSGDFRMTVRVVDVQTDYEWAKSGLMARESLLAESAHFSVLKLASYYRGIGAYWRDATGNTSGGSRTANFGVPYYLRMEREGDSFTAYRSEDGENWIRQGSARDMSLSDGLYVGVATSGHDYRTDTTLAPAIYDEFELCAVAEAGSVTPPTPEPIHPPGLTQCSELLSVSGFEGNPSTVFSYWKGGDANGLGQQAIKWTSAQFFRGSFSLRLHASNGILPCDEWQFQPYLYQEVVMPTDVFTFSTVTAYGNYYVERSNLECSLGTNYDPDDVLNANLYSTTGTPLLAPQRVLDGGGPSGTWYPIEIDLSAAMTDTSIYAGQTLRMQWDGVNDTDVDGTFFYLDDVSLQVCTSWPVPPEQPDTASIGGLVRTRGQNNIPVILPGADVWAYAQGGEVLHTRSIHDGTYHFYNVQPDTYIIYAEVWMSGQLRTATTEVTVVANERNYNVNLLLQ